MVVMCCNRSLILLGKVVPSDLWQRFQCESKNAIIRIGVEAEYKLFDC